jgi:hypothetical protein
MTLLVAVLMLIVIFLSSLAAATSECLGRCDLDRSGCRLASLVLATTHNLLHHGPHVDHHLPCPPSWLQLLAIILVIVILILVIVILDLLCL